MKKTMRILALVLAAMMVLLTCACGSKPAAPADGAKTYIIGTDTVFAPFEYTDANGDFVGIDVEILKAVAEDQGFQYELQSLGFNACLTAVQTGTADAMIAGMTINDERKETYDFSDSYFKDDLGLAVAIGAAYNSLEDLRGQMIAVKKGTIGAAYIEKVAEEYGLTYNYYESSSDMYLAVQNGDAAACCEDYSVLNYSVKNEGGNGLQMCAESISGETAGAGDYGFAVAKGQNAELLAMFNAGLASIKANGTYQQILDKYLAK